MQIKGKADVDVEITPKELVSALKEEVYSRLNLPNPKQGRVYVKDDRWEIQKTVYTSHSFEIKEDLGIAIEEDVEVFTAFHTIAELLKD
tara:strand:- start:38 stop:304 length:267 start_codon:yes stop_codon:yes gene_type:complete